MRHGVRSAALVALVMAVAHGAAAYTLIYTRPGALPLSWPHTAQPIVMHLNDQIGPSLPNLSPGSDPLAAIQRSLAKYPAVSAVQLTSGGTTSTEDAGMDGVNIISFADTTQNRMMFEMAGGDAVIGLTLSRSSGSDITEADVIFNPALRFTTTLDTDAALHAANQFDIEAVATHELGHVIGLHHSGVESAVMWALSSVLQRSLDADDIAGANALYPLGGGRGAIRGTVLVDSVGAFGAQVVAVAQSGAVAASALTSLDGSYGIEQLPPAIYDVYVEPLDGPHSAVPDDPCLHLGNLSGDGYFADSTLTTDFPTRFQNDVTVAANQFVALDFTLIGGKQRLNPVQIGPATVPGDGSFSASISGIPLGIAAGSTEWIAIAGPGVDQVPIAGVDLGPGVTIDPAMHPTLSFTCNNAPLPAMLIRIAVDPSAAVGGRSILFTNGDQRAAFTGVVRIVAAAPTPTTTPTGTPTRTATPTLNGTPPATCPGDCDGNRKVSVDELVKGVNIALGSAVLADCKAFDPSGNGKLTVDELVKGVNAALNGCPS